LILFVGATLTKVLSTLRATPTEENTQINIQDLVDKLPVTYKDYQLQPPIRGYATSVGYDQISSAYKIYEPQPDTIDSIELLRFRPPNPPTRKAPAPPVYK